MLKFRGFPYLAIGGGSSFTSRRYEIEKTWYPFIRFDVSFQWKLPFIIKSYIINPRRRYRDSFLKRIKEHPALNLSLHYFDDRGQDTGIEEFHIGDECPQGAILVVSDNNNNYIGVPQDAEHLLDYEDLTPHDGKTGVICCGYDPKTEKYCGWSHRAKACFGIGDKLFIEDFGDARTPFIEHGPDTIKTKEEAKQAALNFANYVA